MVTMFGHKIRFPIHGGGGATISGGSESKIFADKVQAGCSNCDILKNDHIPT